MMSVVVVFVVVIVTVSVVVVINGAYFGKELKVLKKKKTFTITRIKEILSPYLLNSNNSLY